MESAYVPVEQHRHLIDSYNQLQAQASFLIRNPEQLALIKGDLYIPKEAAEAFRVPLADFLFRAIPDWVSGATTSASDGFMPGAEAEPGPVRSAPDAVETTPSIPGLREVVVAVVTTLAELGLVGAAGNRRPDLPSDLHPAAAPTLAPGEVAGAWQPPPRPALSGPRSAVRRAFYEMLERS